MNPEPVDPIQFVGVVKPLLEAQDLTGLLCTLKKHWTADQIVSLLSCNHCDARKVAALSLGLVGGRCCVPPLAERLKDRDKMVNQMAEHALWSIWFRCGNSAEANHQLCRGTKALNRRDYEHAISHFTRAIELDGGFAEAYNQRAIGEYLLERYEDSLADCQAAAERMPCHFGALAGMGHCHAHLGRLQEAVESYERALEVNPHMEGIREVIGELRGKLENP